MVKPLLGKRALVTGAASGIGWASLEAFAEAGAAVIGLDLKPPPTSPHGFVRADLRNEAEIIAGVAAAVEKLGGLDILVNSAGIMREGGIRGVSAADIDEHFAVNVRGAILTTREALKALGPGGRIINVASELGYLGRSNASVYAASKAAILGLTRSLARELAPDVLVNAIAPGPTDTPMLAFETLSAAQKTAELTQPLGRLGAPHEIAAAIVFLAGPGATFITGHCLGVSGGASMV